ncbi:hypothetical protein HS088_TW18G00374 [Tripterygium wilfordii]|uniref:DUF4378 domain-containing protein n=1 Tax=Tripterygium wilfordii TaxID=458696 RepID=A0A7J7CC89_TRIWF|nr:uncharacterized protein LOC119983380 [Tripterygium wilfordii]KAF5731690.1 hypothetical protein HS088_TW18G00374 [Tripterygium wilfordii]
MCPNTRRPRIMLKDFLLEDLNSCSSAGFKSLPRNPPPSDDSTRRRIDVDTFARLRSGPVKLLRRPSKAASTRISAFQAIINAVKNLRLVKSPSIILPRSLSRSLSRRNSIKKREHESLNVRQVKVTVKDIMRWTSFNVELHSEPLNFASSPDHHCTATTTTTTTTTSSSTCSSSGSSWCDSDFTAEDLPSWSGKCEEDDGENDVVDKKYLPPLVHKDWVEVTAEYTVEPKGEVECEEEEQHRSISSIHHEFEEGEEPLSSLEQVLLLDFLRDELADSTNDQIRHQGLGFEKVIRKARAWLRGEHSTLFELGVDDEAKREATVNELYREGRRWSELEEEQKEIAMEVENGLLCDLMDQLLFDILL